jgi:hypothetical protein
VAGTPGNPESQGYGKGYLDLEYQKFPAAGRTICWDVDGGEIPCERICQHGDYKVDARFPSSTMVCPFRIFL